MSSHGSPQRSDTFKRNKIKTLKDMDMIMQAETVLTRARDRAHTFSRHPSDEITNSSDSPETARVEDNDSIDDTTSTLEKASKPFKNYPSNENSRRYSIPDFEEEEGLHAHHRSNSLCSPIEEHEWINGKLPSSAKEGTADRLIEFTPKVNKPDLMYFTPAPTKISKACEEDDESPLAQSTPSLHRINLIDPGQTPVGSRHGHLPTPLRPTINRDLEKRGALYTIDDDHSLLINADEGTSVLLPTMGASQNASHDSRADDEMLALLKEEERVFNQEEDQTEYGDIGDIGNLEHHSGFDTMSEFHAVFSRVLCCMVALIIAYVVSQLWDTDEFADI